MEQHTSRGIARTKGGLVKRHKSLASLFAVVLAMMAGAFVSVSLIGQAPRKGTSIPRTAWGHPDLQGDWSAGYLLTPLERPAKFAGKEFLSDEEVAALEREQAVAPGRNKRSEKGSVADVEGAYNDVFTGRGTKVVGTKRTSLIVDPRDGKIPPLTPEGQKRRPVRGVVDPERGPAGIADNPEDRRNDRCLGMTIPVDYGSAATSGGFIRVVQSPDSVSIYYEHGHYGGAYRIIPLDGSPHLPAQIRQRLGDARGHWEGDTLVVDTTNFADGTNYYGSKENLHLVERFTRMSDDQFMYRVTISDPTTFTKPWTIEVPYTKGDGKKNQVFESACHEGNYAMIGILAGARALEQKKAAGSGKK
jgi:hypothetical protein